MLTSTAAPGSPIPVRSGSEVTPSVANAPVSATSWTVVGGGVVSRVKLTVAKSLLPSSALVSLMTMVWAPSARTGAPLQAPVVASPVANLTGAAPSTVANTAAPAKPPPDSVASLVIPSLADAPVSCSSDAVTAWALA